MEEIPTVGAEHEKYLEKVIERHWLGLYRSKHLHAKAHLKSSDLNAQIDIFSAAILTKLYLIRFYVDFEFAGRAVGSCLRQTTRCHA